MMVTTKKVWISNQLRHVNTICMRWRDVNVEKGIIDDKKGVFHLKTHFVNNFGTKQIESWYSEFYYLAEKSNYIYIFTKEVYN